MINFTHLYGSATKVPMLIPKYYDQSADCMEDYLNGVDKVIWRCIETGPFRVGLVQAVRNVGTAEDIITQTNNKKENDKRCLCELRGALPSVVYNYVQGCKTLNDI
ncbi:unnamed protein product [Lactuca saligna]|uniref:Uncharacterized protein n=1 Tax=Lactuca saligna TaxID=75948 RepID=A0AA36EIC8_LACSI|nr:unnamed protein product [Lactuca saligna]